MNGRSRLDRVLSACLYGVLALFVAVTVHNFFAYIGHYPYWSIDDGLSVVSTSWLQTGRYGDPAVPIEGFSDLQRYRGFFIYGPWPFAAGTAITWLFGFSIQALRAIHLIAALSLVFVGLRLFSGLAGAIATTVLGVCVSYAVVQIQWPMVRPDIFVTLFAAGLIWSAAVATRDGRPRSWFVAGLAAGCGAFSHLIGATLVPASLVALVAAITVRRSRFLRPAVALVLGWIASAVMFYASFGFRFTDHITHLLRYRAMVRGNTAAALNSTGLVAVWMEHYRIATSGVPGVFVIAAVVALAAAVALIGRALRLRTGRAIETIALLVPGSAIFSLYTVGLGLYPNFHTGYVILPQLIGVWLIASVLYVLLDDLSVRAGSSARLVAATVAVAVLVMAARSAYGLSKSVDDPRIALARSWVAISPYLDEVLGPVPQRAVAWGAVPFAAEGPERIQLISLETALFLMTGIPAAQRPALAPDFLVWGHPQTVDAIVNPFAAPERDPLTLLPSVLPDTEFALASLVSAAPYGATRVYERSLSSSAPGHLPLVSAWDAAQQRWLHDATPSEPVTWLPATGSLLVIKGSRRWPRAATDAVAAQLPSGWYLFRVTLTGDAAKSQLLTLGAGSAHQYPAGDLPPAVDVAARLGSEPVYLVRHHDGGAIGMNLFAADAGSRIGAVDTFGISGLTDYRLARERMTEQSLPALSTWVPDAAGGVTMVTDGAGVLVRGNASPWGYQLVSPRIEVTPGVDVSVRLSIAVDAGRVCTGILDERRQQWIVRPLDRVDVHRFAAGGNHGVFVVLSNCNGDGGGPVASRFTVTEGRYAVFADRWYVDTLMRAFSNRPR
jgi:hypothetical protein